MRAALVAAWVCLELSSAAPAPPGLLHDIGIFSDLDPAVRVTLPPRIDGDTRVRIDEARRIAVLYEGAIPLKAYALSATACGGSASVASVIARLTPEDAAELAPRISSRTVVDSVGVPSGPGAGDSDGDGIPDPLDVLMGARKLVLNHARYTEGYYQLSYPGGDVPRGIGVCSDTIVRAFRNAGIDLQKRVAEDIRAAPAAYPDVHRQNASIDHRRVKTLLTWFLRHVPQVREGPPRPGDVVFLDTFPNRPGPDHVGIISDRTAPSGLPFVINNWTVGYSEGEMDLLPRIVVTHRFRVR